MSFHWKDDLFVRLRACVCMALCMCVHVHQGASIGVHVGFFSFFLFRPVGEIIFWTYLSIQ